MNTLLVNPPAVKNPPPSVSTKFHQLPAPLRPLPRWVLWKFVYKPEQSKWTKVPYSPHSHQLFTRKLEECSNLELAQRVLMNHGKRFSGVGVSAVLEDGLLYLDFDKCLEDGKIKSPELEKFIFDLGSYTEVSPSGLGLRVIAKTPQDLGRWNENQKRTEREVPRSCELFTCEGVEVWNDGKYATLTGNLYRQDLAEIRQNDEVLSRLREMMQKEKPSPALPPAPSSSASKLLPKREWTREEVKEMLQVLDPSMGRADWIKIGKALQGWSSSEGLGLWEEWSRGGTNFIEGECSKVWTGLANKPVSFGHLVNEAKKRGWKDRKREKAKTDKTETPAELPDNYPASDSGNAERLATTYEGKKMRWFTDAGRWMVFNGKRWVEDADGVTCQKYARNCIRNALRNFKRLFPDPKSIQRKEAEAFCLKSENAFGLRNTVSVARTLPEFQIEKADQLDADPHLLNTPNGVVNLRDCRREAHRPELMMTKMTSVEMEEAPCPMWEETIKNATCGDKDLQEALELFLGMSVTGYAQEVFGIFYGASSDNLKSTVCETVADLLGDYASTMSSKSLQALRSSGGENANPYIAGLKGKRLVLADEWQENTKLDEATLKRICSQDTITARMLHSNPITFRPTHTLILRTNHLPLVSAGDEGAWKRIYPFPWNYKVPPEKKDEGYRKKMIQKEGKAILGWLCRCAMRFIQLQEKGGRLPRPKSVEELKTRYRSESDILAQWAETEVEFGQDISPFTYWLSYRAMRDSFDAFAEERGDDPKNTTHKALAMFLGKHNCTPKKNRLGERGWTGIRLRVSDNSAEGGDGVERGMF